MRAVCAVLILLSLAGCVGGDQCGMLYSARLPQPVDSATLTFKFKFDGGYDWTAGGKLGPGICSEGLPPPPLPVPPPPSAPASSLPRPAAPRAC